MSVSTGLTLERVTGAAIEAHLGELAALRIEVFREYPYLYEGTLDNVRQHLRGYAASPRSLVVLARDAGRIVGASTALPLREHAAGVARALAGAGFDAEQVYYFGASMLRASHRGRGLGHAFFDAREAVARAHGFSVAAFCAVQRPNDHPRRPLGYTPHDEFWRKRGYVQRPEIRASFEWRDLDEAQAAPKPMVFWLKELAT
jgi:GNAT superfamily N-acetyltransferase